MVSIGGTGGGVGHLPAHKAAARLILEEPRLPKGRKAYYDALTSARDALRTPYGRGAVPDLTTGLKRLWYEGQPARVVVPEVVRVVNARMQEEIAADVTK
jgi:hypothetical protein